MVNITALSPLMECPEPDAPRSERLQTAAGLSENGLSNATPGTGRTLRTRLRWRRGRQASAVPCLNQATDAAGDGLLDSESRPSRMIGTHLDISARKRIEEELAESRLQLDAPLASATDVAERLRQCLALAEVPIAPGDHGQGCLRMTVSIGVAMCGDEESSIERALGRADRALYEAKAAGRNRIVVSDGYPGPAFTAASGPISIAS